MPGKNKKKGSKKRKQTTCGGASSPRRGSRSRSASPKRSRSTSASPKRSRSSSPKRSRSRSANSNNMNHISKSKDYNDVDNYRAIHNFLMTLKSNPEITVTNTLRNYINEKNLYRFLESLESKPQSKIKEIHKLVDLDYIVELINTDEILSEKKKKEKIQLFKDIKSKIVRLEENAFYRKGPPQLVEATSIAKSLAALRNPRRRW